jgi:microsomal dipeptidase-like Zn-dependent dipeptidase
MDLERISSLHDDPLVPKATEHLGEYRDYPKRFDPKERSVLIRLEQFGVDFGVAKEKFGKDISEFTWEEYIKLLGEAIKARYDIIVGSVFDRYVFPNPENPQSEQRWQEMIKLIKQYEGMNRVVGINLIKRKADFLEFGNLVLGLEAGANLISSMVDVRKLEDHGVKIFGLQYNDDTPLATSSGLTKFGRKVVRYLLDRNLIIDLAHSGYKTRQDIMNLAEDFGRGYLVCYSHGSSEEDIIDAWKSKIGERALKPDEIKRIIKIGGIIGLGVTQPFFSSTRRIAERINDIIQLENGINRIAIGTDFGGVPPVFLNEIRSPDDFKKLADLLSKDFNISEEQINRILRRNVKEWIQQAID